MYMMCTFTAQINLVLGHLTLVFQAHLQPGYIDIWNSSASFDFTKKPDELFSKKFPFFWALLSDFEDTHKHGIYCYNKFRHKYQNNMSKGRIPSLYFFEFLFSRLFKGIFHNKNTYYFHTNSNCFYSIRY